MLGYFLMGGVLGFLTRNHAEGASLSYMEYSIRNYFSKTRHHDVGPDYKNRAKIFIRDEFQRFGLQTELQVFPDIRVSNKTNFTNVIGILKGERFGNLSDRILGVGAHYDTVPTTPGVDDNGAAVVSMLEVARQLTEMNQQGVRRQNTIIFVSFDTEEEGLFGSEIFVRDWFLPFLSRNYGHDYKLMKPYGFVVMDMPLLYNPAPYSQAIIAPPSLVAKFAEYFPTVYSNLQADQFRGDFIALVYRNGSTDIDLAHAFNAAWPTAGHQKFEIESFPLPDKNVARIWVNREFRKYPIIMNFLRSDHTRFWAEDFPAIFLMDTLNYRNYGNVCYHGSCDNVDVYLTTDNMNFLAKTTDSIINSLHLLSQPNGSLPTGFVVYLIKDNALDDLCDKTLGICSFKSVTKKREQAKCQR